MNESPGEQREDRRRDRNEDDVDVKNFANEERRPIEIGLPFHDADEKQIQNCNRKLRNCGGAKCQIEGRIVQGIRLFG